MLNLIISSLAVWRLTNMLVWEAGPYKIFTHFREYFDILHDNKGHPIGYPVNNNLSDMLECFYCTSVWVALVVYISPKWLQELLAISGLAIFAHERLNRWRSQQV